MRRVVGEGARVRDGNRHRLVLAPQRRFGRAQPRTPVDQCQGDRRWRHGARCRAVERTRSCRRRFRDSHEAGAFGLRGGERASLSPLRRRGHPSFGDFVSGGSGREPFLPSGRPGDAQDLEGRRASANHGPFRHPVSAAPACPGARQRNRNRCPAEQRGVSRGGEFSCTAPALLPSDRRLYSPSVAGASVPVIDLYSWPTPPTASTVSIFFSVEECGLDYRAHPIPTSCGRSVLGRFLSDRPNPRSRPSSTTNGPERRRLRACSNRAAILLYPGPRRPQSVSGRTSASHELDTVQWLMLGDGRLRPDCWVRPITSGSMRARESPTPSTATPTRRAGSTTCSTGGGPSRNGSAATTYRSPTSRPPWSVSIEATWPVARRLPKLQGKVVQAIFDARPAVQARP